MTSKVPLRETRPEGITDDQVLYVSHADSDTIVLDANTKYVEIGFGRNEVVSFRQDGSDLILTLKNGNVIVLQNYFEHSEFHAPLDFEDAGVLPAGALLGLLGLGSVAGLTGGSLDADPLAPPAPSITQPVTVNTDGSLVVSGQGVPGSVITMTFPDRTTGTVTVDANGNFGPITSVAGQPAGDIVATATDDAGNVSPPATVTHEVTIINGIFVAGPVLEGNGLTVDVFDSEGNLLASGLPLAEDGSFSLILSGAHPVVVGVLNDANADPDYLDELTNQGTDLTATLMSVGTGVTETTGTTTTTRIALNITPATTIAARLAGVSTDGSLPEAGLTADDVDNANDQTANALGLSDLNATAPVDIFQESFDDTNGDVSEGEAYGQVLAMLSGLDRANDGDMSATIENLVSAIGNGADAAESRKAAADQLLQGATEFEFSNTGNTENEANLLGSPVLGVVDTPEINEDGSSEAPQTTRLLADAVSLESLSDNNASGEGNPNADNVEDFQTIVYTANAVQALAALGDTDEIPQAVLEQLTVANFETLGLPDMGGAESPYLVPLIEAIREQADDGTGSDTIVELRALFEDVVRDTFTVTGQAAPEDDGTLTVSGETLPRVDVVITFPDGTTGTVVSDDQGNFSVTSTTSQTSGDVDMVATDPAGYTASDDLVYTHATAPLAPEITEPVTANPDGTVAVSGTGEASSEVTVTFEDGATGTAPVDDNGNWGPVTSSIPQASGDITASQQDEAGNTSLNDTATYTNTTAPEAPTVESGDGNTDGTLTATGTGEPGATVTVVMPGGETVTAPVGVDGTYMATSTEVQPEGEVTATQVDLNGNGPSGPATDTYNDTTGPATPTVVPGDGNPDGTLTVTGQAEPNAEVTVALPSGEDLVVTAGPNGSYEVTSTTIQPNGSVTATQRDAAGNGPSAPAAAPYVDVTGPSVTIATVTSDSAGFVTVAGVASEPGAVLELTFPDGTTGAVTSNATTGAYSLTSAAGDQPDTALNELQAVGTDANGVTGTPAVADYVDTTPPPVPTIDAAVQDQANVVTGTGVAGDTVTVTGVGTATVLPDGTWSMVSATPIADGATLSAVQTDLNGVDSAPVTQVTFTDTDGDGIANTSDTDDDSDGILDVNEALIQSNIQTTTSQTAADASTNIAPGAETTGYAVGTDTTVFNAVTGEFDVTVIATSPGEATPVSGQSRGTGTVSEITVDLNTVGGETFNNLSASVDVGEFDDGLFVSVNGVTVVDFNFLDWNGDGDFAGSGARFDTGEGLGGAADNPYNLYWQPWYGEGNPELVIDLVTGDIALMVEANDGLGGFERLNALDFMDAGGFDATPYPVPALDFEAGITIGTAFENGDGRGSITDQTVTVSGSFTPQNDTDTDTILNAVDIDTDNDGIWDVYELTTDTDGDAIADFRDTDSNGAVAGDDRSNAALDQTAATAVTTAGSATAPYIIIADDVSLDLTNVSGSLVYVDMEDGAGGEEVTLSQADVIAAAGGELIVFGDAGDTVNAADFVATDNQTSIEGQTYDIYLGLDDSATLIVDANVTVIT